MIKFFPRCYFSDILEFYIIWKKQISYCVIFILWKRNVQREFYTLSHSISDAMDPVMKILSRLNERYNLMIHRLNVLYLSIIRLREDCKQKTIVYSTSYHIYNWRNKSIGTKRFIPISRILLKICFHKDPNIISTVY